MQQFIQAVKRSVEQKKSIGWSRDNSPGFVAEDIVEIFDYHVQRGSFRIVTLGHASRDEAWLRSFGIQHGDPTLLNLRETEQLLIWAEQNPDKVSAI